MRGPDLRNLFASDILPLVLRFSERQNLKHVDSIGEPFACRLPDVIRSRGFQVAEPFAESVRRPGVGLAGCQNVRFAAESSDAFYSSHKAGKRLRLYAFQFPLSDSVLEKTTQFFIERPFYFLQIFTWARGGNDDELASDLPFVQVGSRLGCDLIVIHQAFVQARILA